MEFQTIIVAVIVLFAALYAGSAVRRKMKSFSQKNSCAVDCGCEGKKAGNVLKT